jgi:SEC-C motif-containing protein
MRSRYSAYVEGDIDYILDTHDPETVDTTDRESAAEWSQRAEWLGLEVRGTERGSATDDEGFVEFVARYSMDGTIQAHHERSRFRKVRGRWMYVDGQMGKAAPVVREGPRIGRNDPCPCGSGKKYKKCCGK